MDCLIVLDPAKKDVKRNAYQGSSADLSGFPFRKDTDQKWKKNDSREDQVNDVDEVPRKPVFKKRGKNHRPIRCEKIEYDVTHQNRETDFIKTPEVGTP
ncbi:MAG: hypothetical protein Q8N71_03805 [candidate division Zixibacteria bacterium]|nr:hypothetical protein [candidate division Zixibacteria bacterium]